MKKEEWEIKVNKIVINYTGMSIISKVTIAYNNK